MKDQIILSGSLQDYLEAVLNLMEEQGEVRITDLANRMEIAKSSATEAIKTLSALGMIEHERYGPIFLTDLGRAQALAVRDRHELLRRFLVEVLGVEPGIAEKDACMMEHVISPDTVQKLVAFLKTKVDLS